tara:strand:+ start:382 stop:558 length:177 start_codon:yes stop_codon:yes gene_type:complete
MGENSIVDKRELQEFRDFQDSSHFLQADYTAKTVRRCYILLIISLLTNLVSVFILLAN